MIVKKLFGTSPYDRATVGVDAAKARIEAGAALLVDVREREEWQAGIEQALQLTPTNLHVLQEYKKPKKVEHLLYAQPKDGLPAVALAKAGRLRLCPYYFVVDGKARLSGALATFCPPDKKIIHGMQDAALLPCRVLSLV